ncbi:MAG: knotted carbamoyltransferase YgeW [Myxococcota bacterium]
MKLDSVLSLIKQLEKLSPEMFGTDFLLSWDKSQDEILATALVAEALRALHKEGVSTRVFDSGLALSIFRDKSTRTRFSFASAANSLGLTVADLDEEKSQIAHGETVRETANMISFLTDVIGIRDDMFLGEGNKYMREVADAVQEGFNEGVLHQRPTLVNLQCDLDHPTQSMSDLLQLKTMFGSFEALRGKKIAMSWAYSPSYGKPLSVPQGIISLMTRFGMDVVLAHPPGYDLVPDVLEVSENHAEIYDGKLSKVTSMEEAFADADIVYPKSWAPYHVMQRRTELLSTGDKAGLGVLEKECLANNAKFKNWECDAKKMKATKGGKALYMHCLPADITGVSCKEGEVSQDVFEKYRLDTYREAGFKPFVIAAMILMARFDDPVLMLQKLAGNAVPRLAC